MSENLVPQMPEEDKAKKLNILLSRKMFHMGTPAHGNKKRGVGITRKDRELSKKNKKISAKSSKINRNKKRHHMTSKEKKSR